MYFSVKEKKWVHSKLLRQFFAPSGLPVCSDRNSKIVRRALGTQRIGSHYVAKYGREKHLFYKQVVPTAHKCDNLECTQRNLRVLRIVEVPVFLSQRNSKTN